MAAVSTATRTAWIRPAGAPVRWSTIRWTPGRAAAFKRCAKHWEERLDRREHTLERYENSDVPPPWFDPTLCGESWDGE
jgi:hypothetical protein